MIINGKRALAHIQKVHNILPIEGADNIELVHVLGWTLIAKKGEFEEGDLAVYIEIDSKVPSDDERFAFLQNKGYKVKTLKLNKFGVISQGLALPISLFPELLHNGIDINSDVTEQLRITYAVAEDNYRKNNDNFAGLKSRKPNLFKKPIIKWLMKRAWGRWIVKTLFGHKNDSKIAFPSEYCSKTDEERIQNMPYILEDKSPFVVTEKIDGTSTTYVLVKHFTHYEFIVSSRNVRQLDCNQKCFHGDNVYWEMAFKYNIKETMIKMFETKKKQYPNLKYIVLQGETYGEGIQGNKYKLNDRRIAFFNLIDNVHGKIPTLQMASILAEYHLSAVPIIASNYILPDTVDELLKDATGKSIVNRDVLREGWVIRNETTSFKAVSPEFLLKHKE